eukprot:scaffold12265_cov116-Isochrysis_galbana.AAC.7
MHSRGIAGSTADMPSKGARKIAIWYLPQGGKRATSISSLPRGLPRQRRVNRRHAPHAAAMRYACPLGSLRAAKRAAGSARAGLTAAHGLDDCADQAAAHKPAPPGVQQNVQV